MVFGRLKKEMGRREPYLGNFCHVILLLKGPFIAHFCHFLSQFRPEIPLFKAPSVGPSGPPAGIRERSERDLTRVAQRFDTCCTLLEFASVASEL